MRIDIHVPDEILQENQAKKKRLADTAAFRRPDRPAVVAAAQWRYAMDQRRQAVGDYFNSPRTQVEQQLLNRKWLLEHLRDDQVIETAAIHVGPDLQSIRGGFFPIQVDWRGEGLPVAHPLLQNPSDIERLTLPEPTENLFGRSLQWYSQMRDMAGDYEVYLNGRRLAIEVDVGTPGGPMTHAFALAAENFFVWVYEAPRQVHRLMELCTQAVIRYEEACRKLMGRPVKGSGVGLGCDSAEMLSADMFREFVLPYYHRCYQPFGAHRGFHMCGRIDHLLPILADELKISSLDGFGSVTDPRKVAAAMGGKVQVIGGIDTTLLLTGPVPAIEAECLRYLEILAPVGGYIMQDGNNVAPGTPLENLHAMVGAAEKYARG